MQTLEFKTYKEAKAYFDAHKHMEYLGIPVSNCRCVNKYTKEEYFPKAQEKAKRGKELKCLPCDLPEYISPLTGRPVDGRTARREELKRNGCREVDPSEFQVEYKNEAFIKKHGIQQ